MIIINGYLKNIQGLKIEEIKQCICVSCGVELHDTKQTELYFSYSKRVILLCSDCYNELVLRINKKENDDK
jgi:hypothetical protein